MRSDRWQYVLVTIACMFLFLFAITYQESSPSLPTTSLFEYFSKVKVTWMHLTVFMIWIGIQNITLPFTQLSSWQRLASMKDVNTALKGFKSISFGFFVLWILPVASLLIIYSKGADIRNIGDLFDVIKSMNYFIFAPIYAFVFVGFASALFSTADSAMIALELSIAENISNTSEETTHFDRKKLNIIMVIIISALIMIYYFAEAKIADNFLGLVYVLFSQLAIISPHMGVAIVRKIKKIPPIKFSKKGDFVVTIGIWCAWLALLTISLIPETFRIDAQYAPMMGSFMSIPIAGLFLWFGVKISFPKTI